MPDMTVRRLSSLLGLPAFALTFVLASGACSSSSGGGGSTCTMGEQKSCDCGSMATGTQTCLDTGEFGACSCPSADSGSGSSSGGGDASSQSDGNTMCNGCGDGGGMDAAVFDAAPGTFGAPCMSNADCNSMDCHDYPAKGGSFCTLPCDAGCPAVAGGCNMMGQCKVP